MYDVGLWGGDISICSHGQFNSWENCLACAKLHKIWAMVFMGTLEGGKFFL